MPGFGETLSKARQEKGISLRDVEEKTNIRIKYLRALEEEQLDQIPGRVYAQGFLRTYGRFLGLDVDSLLSDFKEKYRDPESEEPAVEPPPVRTRRSRRKKRQLGRVLIALAAIFTLLMVNWTYHNVFDKPPVVENGDNIAGGDNEGSGQEQPGTDGDQGNNGQGEGQGPDGQPVPPDQVALELLGRERSWISVTVDGERAFYGFLEPGETESFQGKQVYVVIGNAGGTEVVYNGENLGFLGPKGAVVKKTFSAAEASENNDAV